MTEYLLITVIIFFAAIAHGVAGFGQGLIAMPLFAMFIDIKAVIPLSMLNGLSIGSALAFRWRRRLDFTKAAPLVLSSLFGTPIGVYFLKTWDETALRLGLGILLTAFSAYSLSGVKFRGAIGGAWGYVFGFFSGMVGGAFGLNAPVSLIYITSTNWDVEEKKAVMVTNFVISNAVILCLYFVAGVPYAGPRQIRRHLRSDSDSGRADRRVVFGQARKRDGGTGDLRVGVGYGDFACDKITLLIWLGENKKVYGKRF